MKHTEAVYILVIDQTDESEKVLKLVNEAGLPLVLTLKEPIDCEVPCLITPWGVYSSSQEIQKFLGGVANALPPLGATGTAI